MYFCLPQFPQIVLRAICKKIKESYITAVGVTQFKLAVHMFGHPTNDQMIFYAYSRQTTPQVL